MTKTHEPMSPTQLVAHYANGRLSTRPEFYSGRGAIQSDLNSGHLEMLYGGVLAEHGQPAAVQFVRFIADFPVLSATAFLNSFYAFLHNDCTYTPREHSEMDNIDVGPDNDQREFIGMISIFGALAGDSKRDETEMIRGQFLQSHHDCLTSDQQKALRSRRRNTCTLY